MERKDLMIGDWVIRKGVPEEKLRVVAIDSIKGIVYLDLDGLGITEKLTNIEPIPLTPEILERNGFKYYDNPVSQTQGKLLMTNTINGHYIEIRLWRKEMAIWYDYDENNDCVYSDCLLPSLYWLHDFQHALRLCGIDKEVEK